MRQKIESFEFSRGEVKEIHNFKCCTFRKTVFPVERFSTVIYINSTFFTCVKKGPCTHIEQFIQRVFVPQTKLI